MLASIQVLADFSSCFALVLLLAHRVEERSPPTGLVIGYSITAMSFIFFFGPMAIASNLAIACCKST